MYNPSINDGKLITTAIDSRQLFGELPESMVGVTEDLGTSSIMIHPLILAPLTELARNACLAGFQLRVVSGFRSFDRQLAIWNAKALGQRLVLTQDELPVDMQALSDTEKVFAILNWSALPGTSRHHWGTDIDVYDANAITDDYDVQLTAAEVIGIFKPFHEWLSRQLAQPSSNFYRPYLANIGNVAEEMWHLSYRPIASQFAQSLSEESLRQKIEATDIQLKEAILENLSCIYANYVAPYR